jgi:hypothetical protein
MARRVALIGCAIQLNIGTPTGVLCSTFPIESDPAGCTISPGFFASSPVLRVLFELLGYRARCGRVMALLLVQIGRTLNEPQMPLWRAAGGSAVGSAAGHQRRSTWCPDWTVPTPRAA